MNDFVVAVALANIYIGVFQTTCRASKIGPSVQQSWYRQTAGSDASRIGTTHDWHIPVPQAMLRSTQT